VANLSDYEKGKANGLQNAELKMLSDQMTTGFSRLEALMGEHMDYHHENEARWGLIALMSRHPFKTFLVGAGTLLIFLVLIIPSLQNHPLAKVVAKLLD